MLPGAGLALSCEVECRMQLGWRCESNRFKLDAGVMLIRKLIPQMHRAFVIQSPGMRSTKSLALSRII
jgi:hypothetical protein